jgi:hypothetical protein
MRFSRPLLFAGSALLASALPLACGATSGRATHGGTGGTGNGGSSSTGQGLGGGVVFGDGGMDPVVSITIMPPDPTVEVLNGAIPAPITFTAVGKTKGGGDEPLTGAWSYDRLDVATLNPSSGAFTATGLVGGKGTVTFKAGSLSATTSATVKLHYTSDPQMVPSSTKTMFGQASAPDPAMKLLYPYDKTVFPRGLTGPVIQWNGGGANDIYYIHAISPTFELEYWGKVPAAMGYGPGQFAFPSPSTMPMPFSVDVWKRLTDSTSGDIAFSVQRNDGSQPYVATKQTWTIAPANLTGTIYYWAVNAGNVMRLQPGASAAAPFLQAPGGVSCIACHSVSKDGSTIVASFNGGQSPWGTFTAATGASIFNSGQSSGFEAISPDGQYVLWGQWDDSNFNATGSLTLSKNNGGLPMPPQVTPGANQWPVHPAWSSDGKKIAFGVRTDGDGLDFDTSTLWTVDVDLSGPSFSNMHKIVDNVTTQTATVYPTFSPDSKWIAFERCNHSRSRGNLGDVWLMHADGSNPVALDQANGKGLLVAPEEDSTYEPTFMPVSVGGYFWLVVVSERTYGNTLTVTTPVTPPGTMQPQRTKQLWVTAIDASPMPGQDPSHPAFWLPGQDTTTNNMRGEWALSPCKKLGDVCTAGYDCYGGFCHDNGMGMLTCKNQSSGCSMTGDACKTAADCCDPQATCTGGFCAGKSQQ